jgi:hypothetical protein
LTPLVGNSSLYLQSRTARNIKDYEVLAPRKLNQDGDFLAYPLPHFYEHDPSKRRKGSSPDDSEKVHYGLTFDGKDHHAELWPKHYFISPGMMIEKRGVGASLDINNVKIRRATTTRCHYTGRVRGSDYSEPGEKHITRMLSLYLESRATPGISASYS